MTRRQSLSLVLPLVAARCGGETTGRRIKLSATAAFGVTTFDTSRGYAVSVTEAQLSLGALYFFEGSPAVVAAPPEPTWRRALAALRPVGVAHAHPGHHDAGRALGQVTGGAVLGLGPAPVPLPPGDGVTGTYRSASLAFQPLPDGSERVARVAGVATKGAVTMTFVLEATLSEIARSVADGLVTGCAFDEANVDADGVVALRISARPWLNLVDFEELTPLPDGSRGAPADSTARIAFAQGLAQSNAYHFAYTRGTP